MNYEEMDRKLKSRLKPERYSHSKSVEKLAVELAEKWGADAKKARLAGLLHDNAKNMDKEKSGILIEKTGADESVKQSPTLWHGPVGAYLLKEDYGIDDEEIFDAVFYHTIGKKNMSLLTKIIYIADAIEPERDEYADWTAACREKAFKNLDAALLEVTDRTINSLVKRGLKINFGCIDIHNEMVGKLRK